MKKIVIFFGISLIFILNGCSSRIDAVPVAVETHEECNSCKEKETNPVKTCPQEIKTINYVSKCDSCSGFPVTVRKTSTCKYGGGM